MHYSYGYETIMHYSYEKLHFSMWQMIFRNSMYSRSQPWIKAWCKDDIFRVSYWTLEINFDLGCKWEEQFCRGFRRQSPFSADWQPGNGVQVNVKSAIWLQGAFYAPLISLKIDTNETVKVESNNLHQCEASGRRKPLGRSQASCKWLSSAPLTNRLHSRETTNLEVVPEHEKYSEFRQHSHYLQIMNIKCHIPLHHKLIIS